MTVQLVHHPFQTLESKAADTARMGLLITTLCTNVHMLCPWHLIRRHRGPPKLRGATPQGATAMSRAAAAMGEQRGLRQREVCEPAEPLGMGP